MNKQSSNHYKITSIWYCIVHCVALKSFINDKGNLYSTTGTCAHIIIASAVTVDISIVGIGDSLAVGLADVVIVCVGIGGSVGHCLSLGYGGVVLKRSCSYNNLISLFEWSLNAGRIIIVDIKYEQPLIG